MSVKTGYRPPGEHSQAYWRLMIWLLWHPPCRPVFLSPLFPSSSLSLMESDIIPYSSHHCQAHFLRYSPRPPSHLSHHLIPCAGLVLPVSWLSCSITAHPNTADLLLVKSASREGKIYTRSSHASYLRPEGFSFPSSVFKAIKICDVLFLMHNLLTDEANSSVSCQITAKL